MFNINPSVFQPLVKSSSSFYWLRSLAWVVSMLLDFCSTGPHPPVLSICNGFVSASWLLMFLNIHHHFNGVIVGKWNVDVCHSAIFNCPQIGDIELKYFFGPIRKTTVVALCSELFTLSSTPFPSLFKQYWFVFFFKSIYNPTPFKKSKSVVPVETEGLHSSKPHSVFPQPLSQLLQSSALLLESFLYLWLSS